MKLQKTLGIVALLAAGLSFAACGKDAKDGKDGEGAKVDDQIAELQAEIDALKEALKNANEDEIPALQDALKAAEDRLAALENCNNSGNCSGLTDVAALAQLTDVYCDWVFGCCTDVELKATFGAAFTDADACKDYYSDFITRGGQDELFLPDFDMGGYGVGDNVYGVGYLASKINDGSMALDEAKLAACAEEMSSRVCPGDTLTWTAPGACSAEGVESACDDYLIGLQLQGEGCFSSEECVDGLRCVGEGPWGSVCMPMAEAGDPCMSDSQCGDDENSLFCNAAGACQVRAAEGEDCDFVDPTFVNLAPGSEENQNTPCMYGLWCSAESGTCTAACEFLASGDTCYDDAQCGPTAYCDFTADVPDVSQVGECAARKNPGASCDDCASECSLGAGAGGSCDYAPGSACTASDECASGLCYIDTIGSPLDDAGTNTCLTGCNVAYGNSQCAADEVCAGSYCRPTVGTSEACTHSEQCPADQYCELNVGPLNHCQNRIQPNTGLACSPSAGYLECAVGSACVYTGVGGGYQCAPPEGQNDDSDCDDWTDCSSHRCVAGTCATSASMAQEGEICSAPTANPDAEECAKGLFCKLSDNSDLGTGTCVQQVPAGSECDMAAYNYSSSTISCEGDVPCSYNQQLEGYYCPVVYRAPNEHLSCQLDYDGFGFGRGQNNYYYND